MAQRIRGSKAPPKGMKNQAKRPGPSMSDDEYVPSTSGDEYTPSADLVVKLHTRYCQLSLRRSSRKPVPNFRYQQGDDDNGREYPDIGPKSVLDYVDHWIWHSDLVNANSKPPRNAHIMSVVENIISDVLFSKKAISTTSWKFVKPLKFPQDTTKTWSNNDLRYWESVWKAIMNAPRNSTHIRDVVAEVIKRITIYSETLCDDFFDGDAKCLPPLFSAVGLWWLLYSPESRCYLGKSTFERGKQQGVQKRAQKRGFGIYASKAIPKDSYLLEVSGILSSDGVPTDTPTSDTFSTFTGKESDGVTASWLYGPLRMINHSCKPNVEFVCRPEPGVLVSTLRDIEPMEEIFVSYGSEYWVPLEGCPCVHCHPEGEISPTSESEVPTKELNEGVPSKQVRTRAEKNKLRAKRRRERAKAIMQKNAKASTGERSPNTSKSRAGSSSHSSDYGSS